MNKVLVASALLLVVSCAALDGYLGQPLHMGDTSENPVTIGEASADTVDAVSEQAQPAINAITTALTGNPVLGGSAAALAAGLLALASQRLRRKKKQGGGDSPAA